MKKLVILILFIVVSLLSSSSSTEASSILIRDDLGKYFEGYTGTFVLFDEQKDQYIIFNEAQSEKQISPCSTFKIYNSLIGLELGVVQDEYTVFKWNGTEYSFKSWNQDHTLASAIANSVVWYYQELAVRVGSDRMQGYIDKIPYGNCDISGGISNFWLSSSLKISAKEQVELLRGLYSDDLPFSRANMSIVKKIIVLSKDDNTILSGKTGTGFQNGKYITGWFVGEVERNGDRYFFATNIEADNNALGGKAKDISQRILKDMGLL